MLLELQAASAVISCMHVSMCDTELMWCPVAGDEIIAMLLHSHAPHLVYILDVILNIFQIDHFQCHFLACLHVHPARDKGH